MSEEHFTRRNILFYSMGVATGFLGAKIKWGDFFDFSESDNPASTNERIFEEFDFNKEMSRELCLIPKCEGGSIELIFARPNPTYIRNDEGELVCNGYGDPEPYLFHNIDVSLSTKHLTEHRIDKERLESLDEKYANMDWNHWFSFSYKPDKVFEGQRARVLSIVSPDLARSVDYIDLDKNGIINRLWLKKGKHGQYRSESDVIDLDDFEEHSLQRYVTKEYEGLLENMAGLGAEFDYHRFEISRRY